MDKINQLSTGEKLIAGSGILLFLDSFIFPWYDVSDVTTRSGWESPGAIWSVLAVLIGLALAAAVLAPKFGNVQLPTPPNNLTMGQIYLGGGALAFAFLVIKFIGESDYVGIGFWLGFLLTAALAAGGYLIYTEEKTGVRR